MTKYLVHVPVKVRGGPTKKAHVSHWEIAVIKGWKNARKHCIKYGCIMRRLDDEEKTDLNIKTFLEFKKYITKAGFLKIPRGVN